MCVWGLTLFEGNAMLLSDIFEQLSTGELNLMSVGNSGSGEIDDANYDKLVRHINLGLAALHTRFPIRHGEITLQLVADKTTYPISRHYAATNTVSDAAVKYILDTEDALYMGDLMKIEKVTTSEGIELPLNDVADEFSLSTPSLTTLKVPLDIVNQTDEIPTEYITDTLTVIYRAAHPVLPNGAGMYRASTVEIDLPYQFMEPLLYYVASRVNNPMGMTNEFHAGNSYAAKYEMACAALERDNIRVDQVSQPNRIQRNGWV